MTESPLWYSVSRSNSRQLLYQVSKVGWDANTRWALTYSMPLVVVGLWFFVYFKMLRQISFSKCQVNDTKNWLGKLNVYSWFLEVHTKMNKNTIMILSGYILFFKNLLLCWLSYMEFHNCEHTIQFDLGCLQEVSEHEPR